MDNRKEKILHTIIYEHIKTGLPVGSGALVKKYKLDISPATVRNEMAALEEDGYITQPYTSAGRIPTEHAYRLYSKGLKKKRLKKSEEKHLDECLSGKGEDSFKAAAKKMSYLSNNAVFWAFHKNDLYYTGISNLFQQPEFNQIELVYGMSQVIDGMDEIISDFFENIEKGAHVLIGTENPFGDFCSSIIAKYKVLGQTGVFGILGPMRMDYERNFAIMDYALNKINKDHYE